MRRLISACLIRASLFLMAHQPLSAQNNVTWTIPAGGNSFLVDSRTTAEEEEEHWNTAVQKKLFYFHSDRSGKAELSVNLNVPAGKSRIQITAGKKIFTPDIAGKDSQWVKIGNINLVRGYNRVEFAGIHKEGEVFANLYALGVHSLTDSLTLSFVKENQDHRFYWGRRGPSVHLNYDVPKETEVEYFYSEVTIPVGQDPEGSYFMANGFGEGYFGIQVNGPEERRVLFSVWSPYRTDRPGEIPESDRIILLSKGDKVHTGEFGNEGSGGQSYFRYPWKAGTTYRFLLKGTPDGKGNTVYTAWFYAPEVSAWKLIAGFLRPKTDHYLTRLHSFLENFEDRNGYLVRKGLYTNQWCRDKNGTWLPVTKARFTGDDIARRGYRLDFTGGTERGGFFLQNGGFLDSNTKINAVFELKAVPSGTPDIDFKSLQQ